VGIESGGANLVRVMSTRKKIGGEEEKKVKGGQDLAIRRIKCQEKTFFAEGGGGCGGKES